MFRPRRQRFDGLLLILFINLLLIGILMIYSSVHEAGQTLDVFQIANPVGRQILWSGVAIVVLLFILNIQADFWKTFAPIVYGVAILALILVLFVGSVRNGARAWFDFGFLSFQPAELAKLGTLLFLASYLGNFNTDLRRPRYQGIAVGILSLPVALILIQPDAGSALIFLGLLATLYRAGLPAGFFLLGGLFLTVFILALILPPEPVLYSLLLLAVAALMLTFQGRWWWLTVLALLVVLSWTAWQQDFFSLMPYLVGGIGVLFAILHWRQGRQQLVSFVGFLSLASAALATSAYYLFHHILKPHQQERLNVWLNPDACDPQGALYNVLQSKLAIASGGLEGKGFLQGTITRLNYVPEQTTDFIFCKIGEEQGFIGTFGVILLFTLLVLRILQIAERQRSTFARSYAYGVAGIFFLHYFINIGMTIGLMPVIGIPLPFVSYGGTSLVFFTILLGILLKLDNSSRRDRI